MLPFHISELSILIENYETKGVAGTRLPGAVK